MIKSWLQAARLRTLPLAASGIISGAALAWYNDVFSWSISALALLTALLLQILSNFANDYGDFVKGTDNEDRVGPQRTLQSGALSPKQMKIGMIFISILALVSGVILIFLATLALGNLAWLFFGLLGLASIAAAILYTVGKRAYGYHGMGDVMVFVFFGLASVLGTYYLNAARVTIEAIIIAIGIGALSTGVLNLNNMRDIDNDIASGKRTFAARLGFAKAMKYHSVLIIIGIVHIFVVGYLSDFRIYGYFILLMPSCLLINDLSFILKTNDKAKLDPFLKKLSIVTFMLSLSLIFAFSVS